nr:nascent polypeptide-associated complex subunit alpha, muscle-specific form-like [Equus caballus]XP_014596514.1 nascent polypeptide-associated complex subunit alpha, muscle-specific form-like [Equus caballus]
MSVSLKSNTGSTLPRASLPGRRAPISLPSLPSRALGRDPEDSVPRSLWLGPIPPREAPSLPAPRLPTATDAGQPPPAGGGKPRPPQPPLPALLPSLPLSRPPSLSPSLARCRSRGPPAGNLFWTKSRYLRKRKKKGPLTWKRKKERPLTAFICHALTSGRPQFSRPGPGPAAAEVCRACCLAHADRRAPRTARSALPAAAPRQPKHQTDLKVLPTDSTSGCLPCRWPLPGSPLRSVCGQSPHTIHLVRAFAPGPDTPPSQGTRLATRAAALPRTANILPSMGPTQSPCPDAPTLSPRPRPPLPFTCSREGLHLRAEARPWARAECAGEPRSQGGHRGSARLSRAAAGEVSQRPKLSLASSCLFLLLPQVLNTHTPRVQLYKSCSSFPYHN